MQLKEKTVFTAGVNYEREYQAIKQGAVSRHNGQKNA